MGGERGSAAVRVLVVVLAVFVGALLVSSFAGNWQFRLPRLFRPPHPQVVRVEVVNGSGEAGIASRAASFLRDGGFQVTEIRNADRSDYFATLVVARRADVSGARAVARYLGGAPVIRQEWGPELADVSLIIGTDRSHLKVGD
jgi:LytR cell envelope-related transcriptional attenuator